MIDLTRRQALTAAAALATTAVLPRSARASAKPVRLTSVKFGSVSWLIETIRAEGIDKKHGLNLQVIEVANNPAAPIALLSGSADVIVSDWTWALRQRAKGYDLKFAPYSAALGSVMVPKDSTIKSLADLKGKRLGVAGTGIDKSWILLRAYSREKLGKDIANFAEPIFGAAPLVTAEFNGGRLDAVLNFWTYAARLQASGARQLLSMSDVVKGLGVSPTPALVGFIWSDKEVKDNSIPVDVLLSAVVDANAVLAKSNAAWTRLKPLIRPKSDAELAAIRDYYRSGITGPWGSQETAAAKKLTNLLIDLGDAELVGDGTRFDQNLFHT
ncbi:ABC transporter substrate-binding protein [Hyphomicrobium sp.]|jgi:NitT/TauT family transport system substrate-binding protein|uniref:ABC transporter substrate-binding protein n=1 Tax=Hyphomicrobium sp. TaxID=82 RepID=UPI002C5B34F4|nr:ABC transporter substrate-binding protein [Hyphomicrobium sp.]HVZ03711.1 ABC transporter substrate-binding protein [Hyphomicrobium sp.]